MKLIKRKFDDNILRSFYHTHLLTVLFRTSGLTGTSGSPIVNEMGKVVAVLRMASGISVNGTRSEILQSLLNKTRHQEIISNNESIVGWVQQEYEDLNTLAIQGDMDAQFVLGLRFLDKQIIKKSAFFLKKSADQGHRLAKTYLIQLKIDKFL